MNQPQSNKESLLVEDLVQTVTEDLESAARRVLRRRYGPDISSVTLEPAALVNEAYLRLLKQRTDFQNTNQFLGIATRIMLRVLADHERGKQRSKRGGGQLRVTLSGIDGNFTPPDDLWIDQFAEALDELEKTDERASEVAKLCLVWGFTSAEAAETLSVSKRTIERDLRFARAWLQRGLLGQ